MKNPWANNNPSVASGDQKYKGDPYWDDFKAAMDQSGKFTTRQGDRVVAMTNNKSRYVPEYFNTYVQNRTFMDGLEARAKAAADERAAGLKKDGAQPGAGADARDYTAFSGMNIGDIRFQSGFGDVRASDNMLQGIINDYGADPYFKDFVNAMKAQKKAVYTEFGRAASSPKKTAFRFDEYRNFVANKAAEDARAARIAAAANPDEGTGGTGGTSGTGGTGDGGGLTDQELIDELLNPVDPVDTSDSGGTLGEITNGTGTDTTVEEPITTVEEPITTVEEPITTIDENINNDSNIDFTENGESGTIGTGGAGGTLNEVASPGFEIIGNVIYDANGNIIGTTGETAPGIAPVVGGASPTNPVFDEITVDQQAEIDRNARAVELLDSGVGRYNAAVRKMGIIGRQGEEYAPLILDQLRMAEQEAAQPQLAAFGFGQNNMLGGMPQIGVQGVQGNVGGQSALSALSNAGLNQLNVGRQNYNRIALPSVGADGMPISQINNPTIFKASTNV